MTGANNERMLTISLNEDVYNRLAELVGADKTSMTKWISELVTETVLATENESITECFG